MGTQERHSRVPLPREQACALSWLVRYPRGSESNSQLEPCTASRLNCEKLKLIEFGALVCVLAFPPPPTHTHTPSPPSNLPGPHHSSPCASSSSESSLYSLCRRFSLERPVHAFRLATPFHPLVLEGKAEPCSVHTEQSPYH